MKIPLILPNFNQLYYLKNLINQWRWYHPDPKDYPVFIIDNGSDYELLLEYYREINFRDGIDVSVYPENEFIKNLTHFFSLGTPFDYFVLSDADISISPNTPPNFLEIFKQYIELGYHRVGFNLITNDLPPWLHEREMIIGNEKELLQNPVTTHHGFTGYQAPLDTTFCLYKKSNGGWSAPMNSKDWGNSLRLFECRHMGWYVDGDHLNDEQEHYFKTAKYRVPGQPSAGQNNNRPKKFMPQ